MARRILTFRGKRTQQPHAKLAGKVYGHRYTDLGSFIMQKYALTENDARALLADVFRYIEMEVLAGCGGFTVPRFGRFERRAVAHGMPDGSTVTDVVMRFSRKDVKRGGSYIDFEDPEWVEPEEDVDGFADDEE